MAINLNVEEFDEIYKGVVHKECALFLVECLSVEDKAKLKEAWNKAGGYNVTPWYQWCLDNISVSLDIK